MYIYKTTNKVNGKIYVGKRVYRKKDDKSYYGSGTILKRAIKKYGKDNFVKEIIEWCLTREELNQREIYWISKLDARNSLIGYNLASGGEGGNLGKEAVKKIGDALRGRKRSAEFCKAVSIGLSGKPKSKEHVKSVADALRGKKRAQKIIDKMSCAMKEKYANGWESPVKRNVYQYNKCTGDYQTNYSSITKAAETSGVTRKAISNNCIGKSKSSAGYIWSYKKVKNIKNEIDKT